MSKHNYKVEFAARVQLYDEVGRWRFTMPGHRAARLYNDGTATRMCKGRTVRALQLHNPPPGKNTKERSGKLGGTKYSYQEHIATPVAVVHQWDLKRLGGHRGGTNYAPVATRDIFMQVVTDCAR